MIIIFIYDIYIHTRVCVCVRSYLVNMWPGVATGRWQHGSIQANVHDKRDASRQMI